MATVSELSVAITAETAGFERGLSSAQSQFKSFGADLTRIGVGLTAAITAPLALMGSQVLKIGQDYEQSMNIFQSVTRASADEMARAAKVAQQLGADMTLPATSAGDAAKAMTELAKGGLTAAQAMDATKGTLQLAAAAMIDEARAAEITANALNAFGLQAAEAGRVSDLLAAAANASSAEIDDIALSMQQASAVFASANIPIQDLTAAIGLMANAGIKGSDAGTSLKTMIIALSAPTDKAATEMKRLGINIFDAQGQFIPFRGMIEQVSNALKGMTDQQQAAALKTIFGTDALRAANIVMADGVEKFDKMADAVNRTGAAQELAAARAKGLSGAIGALTSQLETLALQIFLAVQTSLEGATRQVAEFIGFLQTLPPEVMKVGLAIAAVFAAAGPIAIAVGGIIALLGGPLTLAVIGVTTVVAAMAAAVALNFGRITEAISTSTSKSRISLADIAIAAGSVLDAFQVFARGTIFAFDVIITGALMLAQGVKAAFNSIKDAGSAALALAQNDMVGFAVAMSNMAATSANVGESIRNSMKGLASRLSSDLKNISSHLSGEFAKSFWFAATQGSKAFGEISSAAVAAGKGIKDATDKGGKGLRELGDSAEKNGKKAAKAIKDLSDEMLAFNLSLQMKGMEKFLTSIGAIPKPAIEAVNALEELKVAEKELAGVTESTAKIIADTSPYVKAAGAAQVLQSQFEQLSRELPRAWNTIIDGFVRAGSAMSVKVKGFASDLINVFDTMPGKWGQSLNRALDEVNKWINFIDSAIKLIQRILGDAQTGLAGVFASIGGLFKKTTADIQASTQGATAASQDWAGALEKMSAGMEQGGKSASESAQKWVAALAAITGALSTFFGTRNQGKGVGILGGALAGAQIGAMFGGLGAAIGAGVGALVGLFKTGKSESQKQAERDAAERVKMDMQQTAQNIINAAIEGFDKALSFFERLDEFTAPRKAKFQKFWASMTKLMNGFVELSKTWAATSFAQVKALAETIAPIADAISALPTAFDAISGHFGVAQSAIDNFFADFSRIMDAFFQRSEVWIDGISKRAMKVANRLSPVVQLISAFGTAMSDISTVKEPSDEMFAIFDRVIDKIVTHVANLSLKFDKAVLKTMANFAEKAGAALAIWKEAIESIKATVDIPTPTEQDVNNVVGGIELFVSKLAAAVERLITTDLARIAAFASTIAPIASAIKAWAETAEVVRGYTAIAAEVWDQIVSDFERGLVLLNLLILDAQVYVEKANIFKSLIEEGASTIASALSTYAGSISSAASALATGLPQGGNTVGTSSLASMGVSSASQSSSQQSAPTTIVNVTVQGTVIEGDNLANKIVSIVQAESRRGRFATI